MQKPSFGYREEQKGIALPALAAEILLAAASGDGSILATTTQDQGFEVIAGGRSFAGDVRRTDVAAEVREALDILVAYRLVEHRSEEVYELTAAGWRAARAMKASAPTD